MSSFREQLGEDWLRYQHHLDQGSPSVTAEAPPSPLSNGLEEPEPLDPPGGQDEAQYQDADTESTLQWPGHNSRPAESTLEDAIGDSHLVATDGKSPDCGASPEGDGLHPKGEEEEEEEDLGGVVTATKLSSSITFLSCWCYVSRDALLF